MFIKSKNSNNDQAYLTLFNFKCFVAERISFKLRHTHNHKKENQFQAKPIKKPSFFKYYSLTQGYSKQIMLQTWCIE